MSATNWATCPQCVVTGKEKADRALEDVKAQYGVMPAEEFVEALAKAKSAAEEAENFPDDDSDYTLEENYGIGIDSKGKFYVDYEAECMRCGYGTEYKHSYDVPITRT